MRRALVLITVTAVALLAAAPAFAPAATGARAGREIERELAIELPSADGFEVALFVNDNDGEVSATLFVANAPQLAYYSAPAKVTAGRVTAHFGALGELDFRFAPKGDVKPGCLGGSHHGLSEFEGEVEFEGTFTFTGENEYVHVEADHAEGTVHVFPVPKGCARQRSARRVVPYHPSYGEEGATLRASAGCRASRVIREVSASDGGGPKPHRVSVSGFLFEGREGMSVARGVSLAAPRTAFHWNLDAGAATLRPPAPFTGSAHFTRHGHNGHGTWTGSLSMPVLGGEPVELAGSDFRAFLHKGVQQDE